MTKLDELKERIERYKQQQNHVITVPVSTLDTLIQAAEAAFKKLDEQSCPYPDCGCLDRRIQSLKEALEK